MGRTELTAAQIELSWRVRAAAQVKIDQLEQELGLNIANKAISGIEEYLQRVMIEGLENEIQRREVEEQQGYDHVAI